VQHEALVAQEALDVAEQRLSRYRDELDFALITSAPAIVDVWPHDSSSASAHHLMKSTVSAA
jgi:hypothetical protein